MRPAFISSRISIKFTGTAVPGALERQTKITGFDQAVFSKSSVLCIGAGGLVSHIAPTLVRKGIGSITLLDGDVVEESNLNRQRFYQKDVGKFKAPALAENLRGECIAASEIRGLAFRFEEALDRRIELPCDVAVCGVDNNPARVRAGRYFRAIGVPVVFTGVNTTGDQGYVFVQNKEGACIACLYPDMVNDDRYPCPGTPAIADILQAVGALAVYAIDTLLMSRLRTWNYRRISLSDGASDGVAQVEVREGCAMFGYGTHEPSRFC